MPLYLTEGDVDGLISPTEAVDAIEECFHRLGRGAIENLPRRRLRMPDGALAVMAATDSELELAGSKTYLASADQPLVQRGDQGACRNNRGTTGIDQQRGRLHACQVVRRDDTTGLTGAR